MNLSFLPTMHFNKNGKREICVEVKLAKKSFLLKETRHPQNEFTAIYVTSNLCKLKVIISIWSLWLMIVQDTVAYPSWKVKIKLWKCINAVRMKLKNQLGKWIKIICSGRGRDYVAPFEEFHSKYDIIH